MEKKRAWAEVYAKLQEDLPREEIKDHAAEVGSGYGSKDAQPYFPKSALEKRLRKVLGYSGFRVTTSGTRIEEHTLYVKKKGVVEEQHPTVVIVTVRIELLELDGTVYDYRQCDGLEVVNGAAGIENAHDIAVGAAFRDCCKGWGIGGSAWRIWNSSSSSGSSAQPTPRANAARPQAQAPQPQTNAAVQPAKPEKPSVAPAANEPVVVNLLPTGELRLTTTGAYMPVREVGGNADCTLWIYEPQIRLLKGKKSLWGQPNLFEDLRKGWFNKGVAEQKAMPFKCKRNDLAHTFELVMG